MLISAEKKVCNAVLEKLKILIDKGLKSQADVVSLW
jgi:hypothetical protein